MTDLAPGDRVAVLTDRDNATIANHGVVLLTPEDTRKRTLVFLPAQNTYQLARVDSLIRVEASKTSRPSFAEIVFNECRENHCHGTYRRISGTKNTFEFVRSPHGKFGFDLRADISGSKMKLRQSHLEIRVPEHVVFDSGWCLKVLRKILRLEFARCVKPA